jgi:hypothetical protein
VASLKNRNAHGVFVGKFEEKGDFEDLGGV